MMKLKRLAIFSDCIHYFDENGDVVTQNHIFCKQMQALAGLFEAVVMYCPFDEYRAHLSATRYEINKISFCPLPKVGGNGLRKKMEIIMTFPAWFRAYHKALKEADVIYQRFPNNLNILGFFYFYFKKAKVFGTYTGTWNNYQNEPLTYRFQKWLLKKYFRGPVGIYGGKNLSNSKLFRSFSPSYTEREWEQESGKVREKIDRVKQCKGHIPVFVTVGSLVKNKNQQFILETFLQLHKEGFGYQLYIAGDGVLRSSYLSFIKSHALSDKIFLTGTLNGDQMKDFYRNADFIVQASLVEGFGKVPLEGFFYGVISLLHDVNLAGEIVGNGERGFLFKADSRERLASLIMEVCRQPQTLPQIMEKGRQYAREHTIDRWVNDYSNEITNWFE